MKFLDLFAGVGGIRLGMEQAGHECVGWVEWDKFARKSYIAIHKPDGEFTEKDINNVNSQELPKADCWCFGFPCQDISVAGKQGGFTNGKRSSLFFKVTGLIRELKEEDKPSYLFIENVKNLLSINKGWDFAKLLIEMDEIGYDVEWDILDSAEVVPQHRERIFIVGHLRGRSTGKVFPIVRKGQQFNNEVKQVGNLNLGDSFGGNEPKVMVKEATKKGFDIARVGDTINLAQPNSKTRRGRVGHGVANTLTTGIEQATLIQDTVTDSDSLEAITNVNQGVKVEAKPAFGRFGKQAADTMNANEVSDFDIIEPFNHRVHKDQVSPTLTTRPEGLKTAILPVTNNLRIRKLIPLECWRLQGFPDWAFNRAKQAGLSDSQLYKQAGNSVTVPVIKAIANRMKILNN